MEIDWGDWRNIWVGLFGMVSCAIGFWIGSSGRKPKRQRERITPYPREDD